MNNPLAGPKSCVHALDVGDADASTRSQYIDLRDEADVVRQLLEFGLPRPLDPIKMSLRRVTDDVSRLVAAMLRRRRIELGGHATRTSTAPS